MMDGTAVEAIAQLARDGEQVHTLSIEGRTFTGVQLYELPDEQLPEPVPLHVHTLRALADYLKLNTEQLPAGAFVHIANPALVRVLGPLTGESLQRFCYVAAMPPDAFQPAPSSSPAAMVVWIQAAFAPTERRNQLLRIIGNLADETTRTSQDDGTSQVVSVKAGVHTREELTVQNPFHLRPYRTFPEIAEPPEVPYIVRFEAGPTVRLFEVMSAWRNTAIEQIAAYLIDAGVEVPVLG